MLAVLAGVLFVFGAPGQPSVPPIPDFDFQSSVALYMPPGLKADTAVVYQLGGANNLEEIDLGFSPYRRSASGLMILQLQGLAQYQNFSACCSHPFEQFFAFGPNPLTVAERTLYPVERSNGGIEGIAQPTQLIAIRFQSATLPSYSGDVSPLTYGTTADRVANQDNGVVGARLPQVNVPRRCLRLAHMSLKYFLRMTLVKWTNIAYGCTSTRPDRPDRLEILNNVGDVSIQTATVTPPDTTELAWHSDRVIDSNVIAYTLLSAQANAQRLLFVSGAVVGLAGGFLTLGVEPWIRYAADRRRRSKSQRGAKPTKRYPSSRSTINARSFRKAVASARSKRRT